MDLKTLRQTDENALIFPGAAVAGDVAFGPDCSVWFNAVIRGDGHPITLGRGCNVQDCAVLHAGTHATTLGDYVSVGHGAIVHGCTIGSGSTVGMGAIVLDGARIGRDCLIGAGSLVTGKMDAPDGSLILGNPAKVLRQLSQQEIIDMRHNTEHYAELKESYR